MECKDTTFEHAWKYFELHSKQRMHVFNFFVVLAGFNLAGLAATFQGNSRFGLLGVLLGGVLALLSFVFWKLDQRTSFLIKHAEDALIKVEQRLIQSDSRLFENEVNKTSNSDPSGVAAGIWTYGRSFRLTFAVMASIGIICACLAVLRSAEILSFDSPKAPVSVGDKVTGR